MPKSIIPVFILGGFLGSGKTSTLNHILRNSQSSRLGVIVNDFGELPIDSYLIDSQVDNQIQLTNGCICCEVQDGDLVETLEKYSKMTDSLDAIFIESSGLADPNVVANTVRYANLPHLNYGGIIYTLDLVNFAELIEENQDIDSHLRTADVILLNKVDLATEEQIKNTQDYIKSLNAKAVIILTSHGAIDPRILFDLALESSSDQLSILDALKDAAETQRHRHHNYSSVSFKTNSPLNPKVFTSAMRTRLEGVYRIKGIAYFGMKGMEQKYIFHSVRGAFDMTIEEWADNETPRTEIVAIGTDINETEINKILSQTIDTHPGRAEPGEMVDVRRLLERAP